MRRFALMILILLLLPAASAHGPGSSDVRTLRAGDYDVLMSVRPSPLHVDAPFNVIVHASERGSVGYATGLTNMTVTFTNESELEVKLNRRADHHMANTMLPKPGEYAVRLRLVDANGTHEATTNLRVYPDLGFSLTSTVEDRIQAGMKVPIEVETRTGAQRSEVATDLTLRIEHWNGDHLTLLGVEEVDMHQPEPGLWNTEHMFAKPGMYHIFFSSQSGGFGVDDVPSLHVTVFDFVDLPQRSVGIGGISLVTAAVGVIFLVQRKW